MSSKDRDAKVSFSNEEKISFEVYKKYVANYPHLEGWFFDCSMDQSWNDGYQLALDRVEGDIAN